MNPRDATLDQRRWSRVAQVPGSPGRLNAIVQEVTSHLINVVRGPCLAALEVYVGRNESMNRQVPKPNYFVDH